MIMRRLLPTDIETIHVDVSGLRQLLFADTVQAAERGI